MIFKPHNYQKAAIDFATKRPYSGLFLDMGLGKTAITLDALQELMFNRNEVKRCLIIAPLRVAWDTWTREITKWEGFQLFRVSQVLGSAEERQAALHKRADIYLINRENVDWLVKQFKLGGWPFDMIVVDELSSFKSSKSARFRALKKVRGATKRFIGLTGTPAPNGLLDLWSQLFLIDGGQRLGYTKKGYQRRYFIPIDDFRWELDKGADTDIYDKIKDVCMSMRARDVLPELPETRFISAYVTMTDREKAIYKKLKDEMVLELDGAEVVAQNAGVLAGKLLQMANGQIYSSPMPGEEKEVLKIHDHKVERLAEIIEAAEVQDETVLVFYQYKHDLLAIKAQFPSAEVIGGPESIKRWNEGKIKILLVQPQSASHGLNMQDGGHIIIWYGLTFNLELYSQANARLARQGQKNNVLVYLIMTDGTIDDRARRALEKKNAGQSALIDAVKKEIYS